MCSAKGTTYHFYSFEQIMFKVTTRLYTPHTSWTWQKNHTCLGLWTTHFKVLFLNLLHHTMQQEFRFQIPPNKKCRLDWFGRPFYNKRLVSYCTHKVYWCILLLYRNHSKPGSGNVRQQTSWRLIHRGKWEWEWGWGWAWSARGIFEVGSKSADSFAAVMW